MAEGLDEKARRAAEEWLRGRLQVRDDHDSLAAAFKAFAEEAREEERRMVVEWLRAHDERWMSAAAMIEAGAHRPTQGEKRAQEPTS